MSITWGILRALMVAVMDETDIDTGVDRTPQMQWAMRTFAEHTPHQGTYSQAITAAQESVVLPTDFLSPRGVFFTDATLQGWAPYLGLSSGVLGNALQTVQGAGFTSLGWWLWPATRLNTLNMIGNIDLYYYAYYPTITGEEDQELPIPDWAIHPLIWLATVYAVIPTSVATSNLNRWAETTGGKLNPVIEQINYFQKQYEWELANHAIVERELIIPERS